jgi:hypothetical protein
MYSPAIADRLLTGTQADADRGKIFYTGAAVTSIRRIP